VERRYSRWWGGVAAGIHVIGILVVKVMYSAAGKLFIQWMTFGGIYRARMLYIGLCHRIALKSELEIMYIIQT